MDEYIGIPSAFVFHKINFLKNNDLCNINIGNSSDKLICPNPEHCVIMVTQIGYIPQLRNKPLCLIAWNPIAESYLRTNTDTHSLYYPTPKHFFFNSFTKIFWQCELFYIKHAIMNNYNTAHHDTYSLWWDRCYFLQTKLLILVKDIREHARTNITNKAS